MARDFQINGESMVWVKGRVGSTIANLSELGLAQGPINVSLEFRHREINLDAWGGEIPADVQAMLAAATITIPLIHYDNAILEASLLESLGCNSDATAFGALARAGTRLGGGNTRFAAGNHYIGLNIASPIEGKPWRFYYAYLTGNPAQYPLGTEKKVVQTTWRAIPYTTDPWNGGLGAAGTILFDRTLDT